MPRPSHLLTLLAAAALLGPGTLVAQAPAPEPAAGPVLRSLWFDAGALGNDQIRVGAEAIPVGRFTVGLSVSYSHKPHPRDQFPYPIGYLDGVRGGPLPQCDPRMLSLCAYPDYYYGYGAATRYRAWAFDLAVRYYPEALSFRNGAARMMVYGGAYAGYHWRVWDEQPSYSCYAYPCPLAPAAAPPSPLLAPADSVIVLPPPGGYYPAIYQSPIRHLLKGVEPGVELGVRLLPIGPLFLEAGGRFTLAVVDDPMQRVRPGDVDARLVLAAGISW